MEAPAPTPAMPLAPAGQVMLSAGRLDSSTQHNSAGARGVKGCAECSEPRVSKGIHPTSGQGWRADLAGVARKAAHAGLLGGQMAVLVLALAAVLLADAALAALRLLRRLHARAQVRCPGPRAACQARGP